MDALKVIKQSKNLDNITSINIRLPESLKVEMNNISKSSGVSVTKLINTLIEDFIHDFKINTN